MGKIIVKLIKNPFVITLVVATLLTGGIIWGVLNWLDVYTRHNEAIVVPDIKGLKLDEAIPFLENNHLRYNVVDSVFSKEVAPGAIVEVIPNVGAKVKEGRILFILKYIYLLLFHVNSGCKDRGFFSNYKALSLFFKRFHLLSAC